MTVNLTTFEELLTTMTATQKINKSGGWTPVMTGDRLEAKTRLNAANTAKYRGMGNWSLQKGESYLSFSVLSSLEKMGVPGSGKPTAMK